MDAGNLSTARATIVKESLFRVQIPADSVAKLLEAIINVTPLTYGNYEHVAFRYNTGTQQYKPLVGSKTGEAELTHIPCNEISFTVPKHDELITAVIDAIIESHPHEEPVILIQEAICTRFSYGQLTNIRSTSLKADGTKAWEF